MSRDKLWDAVERRALAEGKGPDQVAAALARRLDLRAVSSPSLAEMLTDMGAQVSISPYDGSWHASLCGERDGGQRVDLDEWASGPLEAVGQLHEAWAEAGRPPFAVLTSERAEEIGRQVAKRNAWTDEGRARDGSEDGR